MRQEGREKAAEKADISSEKTKQYKEDAKIVRKGG